METGCVFPHAATFPSADCTAQPNVTSGASMLSGLLQKGEANMVYKKRRNTIRKISLMKYTRNNCQIKSF